MMKVYKSLVMECDSGDCNRKQTYSAETDSVQELLMLARNDGWKQKSALTCRCPNCSEK